MKHIISLSSYLKKFSTTCAFCLHTNEKCGIINMMDNQKQNESSAEEFVNLLVDRAVAEHASDIHIEPRARDIRIRLRIDGVLHELGTKPLYELDSILNRIRVLSDLDIATRVTAQEGHFIKQIGTPIPENQKTAKKEPPTKGGFSDKLTSLLFSGNSDAAESPPKENASDASVPQNRVIDVRVSLFPTTYGDATVMRLLSRQEMLLGLDKIGMDPKTLATFRNLISKIYGMVLITGPSGAGKTTTLYSILQEIRNAEKNIITLEDPVELNLENIRQSQVEPEHGLTLASGIQRILRQDPDAIMIGEIRDPLTAEQAIRASLMGRIVFSTIHSNTTLGTIARLIDMNVERSLIAYALNGVLAQRLVRKICAQCQTTYIPEPEYLKYFSIEAGEHEFIKGKGCDACRHTGFLGRTGIFEVIELDDSLQALIIEKAPMSALQEYVATAKLKTLKQDALKKVLSGITTIEEAAHSV